MFLLPAILFTVISNCSKDSLLTIPLGLVACTLRQAMLQPSKPGEPRHPPST